MKYTIIPILTAGLVSMMTSHASLVISSLNTTSTINFTDFTGAGFQATPAAGQLDSDAWRVTGFDDNVAFGDTVTTGDPARGLSNGGATTGGIYAFDVDPTATVNRSLGVQPGSSDFTPGAITLRIQNTTGVTVTSWNLSYALYVLNDEARSNSMVWAWSTDDSSYTQLSTYTSTAAADGPPAWSNVQSPSSTGVSASVANNGFLYLRWTGDDVGGSNFRDEFAIDDISITAIPEPSAALLGSLGLLGLLRRRRR